MAKKTTIPDFEILPLTPERWPDLETLFGPRGACAGCWCMWWRLRRSQFQKQQGPKNRRAFRRIVLAGEVPGLLAYVERKPVAWCAVAPRETYPVLERSRTLKRIDDQPAWSVVCFFIARVFRRKGLTLKLLRAAVEFARKRGAEIIEGYPVEPKGSKMPDAFAWTGFPSAFRKAGFVEVLRRSPTRPMMRCFIEKRKVPTVSNGFRV